MAMTSDWRIDLSGQWQLKHDPENRGKELGWHSD